MGQKIIRVAGFIILALVVFGVVWRQTAAQTAANQPTDQVQFQPGSAASQSQIEVTRVVYVTATPQPTAETAGPESEPAESEPLSVVNRLPEERPGADLQPTFQLTFNKPVRQQPRQPFITTRPEIPLSIYWEQSNVVLIRPKIMLEPENAYYFTLVPDLTALDGSVLEGNYSWSYYPMPLIDSQKYLPLPDGRGSIELVFNYPIDPATVLWRTTPNIGGSLTWSDDLKSLTFEAAGVFLSGQTITVDLGSGIRQPNGSPVAPPETIEIEVAGLAGSIEPSAGRLDVDPITTIQVQFRREVDRLSAESGFAIEPEPLVAPEFAWDGNTLFAAVVLAPRKLYSVSIAADYLLDPQGRQLSQEAIRWSFQTSNNVQFAGFGSGPRLQTLQVSDGPDDRLSIEFSYPDRQAPVPVTFELYEMPFSDWLAEPNLSRHDIYGQLPLASWEEQAPFVRSERYFTTNQTILPDNIGPGFYRLRMSAFGIFQDELAILVTDLALAIRDTDDLFQGWVVDLDTLAPATAEVTIYQSGQPLAAGVTDGKGLVSLTVDDLVIDDESALIFVATAGDSFTVAVHNYEWFSHRNYGYDSPDYLLHLSLDRPLYSPGETAYLRAVLRANNNGTPTLLPPNQTLTVTVFGATHEGFQELEEPVNLTTNANGVAYGEVIIPTDFTAGQYHANIIYKGIQAVHDFEVAIPQPPLAPIVKVTTPKIVAQGEMLDVTVEVMDRNGRPIAGQQINISYLYPAGEWNGCYWSSGANEWNSQDTYNHSETTDQNGRYSFSIPAEMGYDSHAPHGGSNMRHSIMAIVASAFYLHDTGTGFSVVEIANTAEELQWQPASYVQTAGQPFVLQGLVHDLAGYLVQGRAVTLTVNEVGQYGLSADVEPGARLSQQEATTNAAGQVAFDLTVDQPGYYDVRLVSQDGFGNEMVVVRPLYVTGEGEAVGIPALKIGLAQPENYVGQTAQVVVLAAEPGPALMTITNLNGLRDEVIYLDSFVNVIDLPLTAVDAPALNIEINLWQTETAAFDMENFETMFSRQDADLLYSSLRVPVIDPDKQLRVSILDSGEPDENGQTAVTVQVLNGRGHPVSAEVSLAIAGQSLFNSFPNHNRSQYYSLFKTPAIEQTVYHSFAPQRDLSYEYWGGCGCGGGWWGDKLLPAPINEMPSFWFSGLYTDHNGQVTVLVSLPDNPDGWHVSAQAITAEGQVGEGSQIMNGE